jgi:hypothetical protein
MPFDRIAIEGEGSAVTLLGGKVTRLRSIW